MKKQFTQTVPALSRADTRCARDRFSVKTIAFSPYRVSLARATTSSSVSNGMATTTGPKISSVTTRASAGAPVMIVGCTPQPSPRPPVTTCPPARAAPSR